MHPAQRSPRPSRNSKRQIAIKRPVCVCHGRESDERMIACELCDTWYHFNCVQLTPPHAEEIELFICEGCAQETDSRSIMFWEGIDTDAYYEDAMKRRKTKSKGSGLARPHNRLPNSDVEPSEGSDAAMSPASDVRYDSDSSGTEFSDSENEALGHAAKTRKTASSSSRSASPYESNRPPRRQPSKRKTVAPLPPSKRSKLSHDDGPLDPTSDPARKYCLSQLEAVLLPIFTEHPMRGSTSSDTPSSRASTYAREVEINLFEHFAEPDKQGVLGVGHKYKTQFRSLTFNLGKADRQVLRRRIGEGGLSAPELSGMSNEDLASEQQKKKMEDAHQESLHQSILDGGIDRPLRKITHKGEEEIEDQTKQDKDTLGWSSRAPKSLPRLDTTRKGSISVTSPLESLATPSPTTTRHAVPEPMVNSPSTAEPFSDISFASENPIPAGPTSPVLDTQEPDFVGDSSAPFNINAIAWSPHHEELDLGADESGGSPLLQANEEVDMDASDAQSIDLDFNDFLESDRPQQPTARVDPTPVAPVWSGELRMPSANNRPIAVKVDSHLVAGRPSTFNDLQFWRNLFPSAFLTIEGRVPIPAAESYLLNSRLNSGRELVAVSFTPSGPEDRAAYEELSDGLLAKGRHAVILPWGNPPPGDAPGKELYLVPLRPSDRPEYLDMLEHLSLPAARSEILLVGVFILHRAKKAIPAPPVPVAEASAAGTSVGSASVASALGIDLSALTPEFIADLLKSNPAISAAASAAFAPPASPATAYPSTTPAYPPYGHSPPGPAYGNPNISPRDDRSYQYPPGRRGGGRGGGRGGFERGGRSDRGDRRGSGDAGWGSRRRGGPTY